MGPESVTLLANTKSASYHCAICTITFSFVYGVNVTDDNARPHYMNFNPFDLEVIGVLLLLVLVQSVVLQLSNIKTVNWCIFANVYHECWLQFAQLINFFPRPNHVSNYFWLLASLILYLLYWAGFRSSMLAPESVPVFGATTVDQLLEDIKEGKIIKNKSLSLWSLPK